MEERGLIKRARNYFKSELRLRIDHIWLRHRTSRKKNGSLPQEKKLAMSRQKKKNWSEIRPCKIQTWTFSLNIWNILLNTFKTFDILYLYYIYLYRICIRFSHKLGLGSATLFQMTLLRSRLINTKVYNIFVFTRVQYLLVFDYILYVQEVVTHFVWWVTYMKWVTTSWTHITKTMRFYLGVTINYKINYNKNILHGDIKVLLKNLALYSIW